MLPDELDRLQEQQDAIMLKREKRLKEIKIDEGGITEIKEL